MDEMTVKVGAVALVATGVGLGLAYVAAVSLFFAGDCVFMIAVSKSEGLRARLGK